MEKIYPMRSAMLKDSAWQRPRTPNLYASRNLRKNWQRNSTKPMTRGMLLLRSLLGFTLLLMLMSCATPPPPRVVAVPCPAFPPRPSVELPEVGHYHLILTSILQNGSTAKSLTPAITP